MDINHQKNNNQLRVQLIDLLTGQAKTRHKADIKGRNIFKGERYIRVDK